MEAIDGPGGPKETTAYLDRAIWYWRPTCE